MPVQPCTRTVNGEAKVGRRWGDSGVCYPCAKVHNGWDCTGAEKQARRQGRAIENKGGD